MQLDWELSSYWKTPVSSIISVIQIYSSDHISVFCEIKVVGREPSLVLLNPGRALTDGWECVIAEKNTYCREDLQLSEIS